MIFSKRLSFSFARKRLTSFHVFEKVESFRIAFRQRRTATGITSLTPGCSFASGT